MLIYNATEPQAETIEKLCVTVLTVVKETRLEIDATRSELRKARNEIETLRSKLETIKSKIDIVRINQIT